MKTLTKTKHKKQPSPNKRKNNPFSNACIHDTFHSPPQPHPQSKMLSSSTQMLVSLSQTQHFKLDFLIESYEQLITTFKLQRKQFIQEMKMQFQRHLFYYTQIITLAKTYQENTKIYLRSKLQDVSNVFQLKISLIEMKLKNTRKLLFENDLEPLFAQKKSKIKKSSYKKQLQIGKTSSYEDGIDFDEELREIYNQKGFQVNLNFIELQEVQYSLQNIKTQLIKDWQKRDSLSVSFSSVSNPQQSQSTFRDICHDFELESEDEIMQSQKDFMKERLKSSKNSGKYAYVSNETNTSAKEKMSSLPVLQFLDVKKKSWVEDED